MFCAISNVVPTEPVASSTGYIFERSVIEKHLETEAKCPISGEDLTKANLVAIKSPASIKPRTATATSVPGLLSLLQDEWDAVMLETYTLRQHVTTVRQELSQALYQHDAACRVIARLTKERDQARAQLQRALSSQAGAGAGDVDMGGKEEEGIPSSVIMRISTLSESLTAQRKKRPTPEGQASKAAIRKYAETSSRKIHKASKGGILCLDTHSSNVNLTLTGGVDNNVLLFDHAAGKIATTFSGHSKRVSGVAFHPTSDRMLSCAFDQTVKVWRPSGDMAASFSPQRAEITDLAVHPSGDYVLTSGMNRTYAFSDLNVGRVFTCVKNPEMGALESIAWHPDAVLFGAGTADSMVHMWDVKTLANVASFKGHTGAVSGVAFSENGYHMASTSKDGSVRVWDLRNLQLLREDKLAGPGNSVAFDQSGKLLVVGSSDVQVFNAKNGAQLCKFEGHSSAVMGVRFGPGARFVASASLDKTLRMYA